eukprot:TRINITY_DN2968_c0_g1_i1.p1 TRINITY_DN2968_c0_g1~~TRINITY_DN2968_c0_g1_i1.p1  ORF type:complete len:331 (-),score=147.12 TRINITY_DN2968_c0_g1_i1:31-1023(-)
MAVENEMLTAKKHLDSAISKQEYSVAIDLLTNMENMHVSAASLNNTKLGFFVGKLRKHENEKIAKKAAQVVANWKQKIGVPSPSIGKQKSNNNNNNNNNNNKIDSPINTPKKPNVVKERIIQTSPKSSILSASTTSTSNLRNSGGVSNQSNSRISENVSNQSSLRNSGGASDLRQKMVEKFKECLIVDNPELANDAQEVATNVEEEVYKKYSFNISTEYKEHWRTLLFNIKRNKELREDLLQMQISANKLCQMSSAELASSELRQKREESREWYAEAAQLRDNQEMATELFKCSRCKQRKCVYLQLQIRSADEPMTTFVRCTVCSKTWNF